MPESKVFVVVQIEVNDPEVYRQYGLANHAELFDEFGATFLAGDDDVDVIEGRWPYSRTVIIEFPSHERARAWYQSDGYQAVVGLRHASADSNMVIVSGFPG